MKDNINHNKDRRLIYPTFSKSEINKAGQNIINNLQNAIPLNQEDEEKIENWRASHTHILNTWQGILRSVISNPDVIFVQRLKRRNTIYDKLMRFPTMSLARMHDIAGCRLIFKNKKQLCEYIDSLHSPKQFLHELKESECKDYIKTPKDSGYRGLHDVYIYKIKKREDRSDKWNGLRLEIQYRTIHQHAWATAVEVAGTLTGCRTKFSEGDEKQQEFFRLASEIIARVYENEYSCKKDLTNIELVEQFNNLEKEIGLLSKLKQIKKIQQSKILQKNAIIHFNVEGAKKPNALIHTFDSLSEANLKYFKLEKQYPNDDIVLVRTSDKQVNKSLKEAYRNYFADTTDFTDYIEKGLKSLENRK